MKTFDDHSELVSLLEDFFHTLLDLPPLELMPLPIVLAS